MRTSTLTPASSTQTNKKMTKAEYKAVLLNNLKNNTKTKFDIDKVQVSKNDPIITTVKNVLDYIK
jgi:hypothetical protein